MKKEVVSTLPDASIADDNTMYLVATDKGFAEWVIINGVWEKLGDTSDIDLTGYVKYTDITTISNIEIDALFNI